MAKKELFRGFSRIFVDAGNETERLKNEIYSGFSRIFVDEDKGAETEITIKDDTEAEEPETEDLQQSAAVSSEVPGGSSIEVEDGDAEVVETVIEESVVTITTGPEPQDETPQPQANNALGQLSERLDAIEAAVKDTQHKDALIRDLHKEMEGLKNDFYASLRRPIIKSIIAIHRRMDERQKYLDAKAETCEDYQQLLNEVVKNMQFDSTSVLDTLEDEFDLVYFEPNVGDAYNPKEENAVKVEETDNPVLGGTVKDVLYGGFKEAITGRVWQKANITVYRNKK